MQSVTRKSNRRKLRRSRNELAKTIRMWLQSQPADTSVAVDAVTGLIHDLIGMYRRHAGTGLVAREFAIVEIKAWKSKARELTRLKDEIKGSVAGHAATPPAASSSRPPRRSRDFLDDLLKRKVITRPQHTSLLQLNVRSPEQIFAYLETFPAALEVFDHVVQMNLLREFPIECGLVQASAESSVELHAMGFGGPSPADSDADIQKCEPTGPTTQQSLVRGDDILLFDPTWAVRNQLSRGTCVAFATVACREATESSPNTSPDLSEQFVYCRTRQLPDHPPLKTDGTWLAYSQRTIAEYGVCREGLWPYNGTAIPGNIPQEGIPPGSPSARAISDASTRTRTGRYAKISSNGASVAQKLYDWLKAGRPVAASLPVYSTVGSPSNNWQTTTGNLYGEVLDPPPAPLARVTGGHCVCIIGYRNDEGAAGGGVFIIRNSWGTNVWGTRNPDTTGCYHAPAAGHGQCSAQYVEQGLMEMFQFS